MVGSMFRGLYVLVSSIVIYFSFCLILCIIRTKVLMVLYERKYFLRWQANFPLDLRKLPFRQWKALDWKALPEGPLRTPHSKQRDEMLLHKALMGSQWEAFTRDLDLVWKAREDYFKTNHPHFDHETSHDPTDIFQDMIASAGLLGSQIYEIQKGLGRAEWAGIC